MRRAFLSLRFEVELNPTGFEHGSEYVHHQETLRQSFHLEKRNIVLLNSQRKAMPGDPLAGSERTVSLSKVNVPVTATDGAQSLTAEEGGGASLKSEFCESLLRISRLRYREPSTTCCKVMNCSPAALDEG